MYSSSDNNVVFLLKEVYKEYLFSQNENNISQINKESVEKIINQLWNPKNEFFVKDLEISYQINWLSSLLKHHSETFWNMWRNGKIEESIVFKLLDNNRELVLQWLLNVKDSRIKKIFEKWNFLYVDLLKNGMINNSVKSKLIVILRRLVRFSSREYISWGPLL